MARSADSALNPDLLVWARRNSSLTIEQVAKEVSVKPERLKQWEKGELIPIIKQLSKLGHIYKRPIAIFYRPMMSIPNLHRHGMLPRTFIWFEPTELVFPASPSLENIRHPVFALSHNRP